MNRPRRNARNTDRPEPRSDDEFTMREIVVQSKRLARPCSARHVNQILAKPTENGLVYKNRHGRYSFAVQLLRDFIRQLEG